MKKKEKTKTKSLQASLKELESITKWFEQHEDLDIEQALLKAREGARLIKELRSSLANVQNEFQEITEDLKEDQSAEQV